MDENMIRSWRQDLAKELALLVGHRPYQTSEGWPSLLTVVVSERQGRYWNHEAMLEAYRGISRLVTDERAPIDAESVRLFLTGYQAYRQILPSIKMLEYKYVESATKARLYTLPIYISLAEGCMSNFMRLIVRLIDSVSTANYGGQDQLKQLINVLEKHGFVQIAGSIDSDLRNAINHGGVYVQNDGREITYTYKHGGERYEKTVSTGEVEHKLRRALDVASALVIALVCLLSENMDISALEDSDDAFLRNNLAGIEMSDAICQCSYTSEVPRIRQVNFTFDIVKNDETYVFSQTEHMLKKAYMLLGQYNQYLISFNNTNLLKNFFRATREEIEKHLVIGEKSGNLIARIAKRRDVMWSKPNVEASDAEKLEYYRFPVFESSDYSVYEIEDASLGDRKRIRATVYVGDIDDKSTLVNIVDKSIKWLRALMNPPSPATEVKHGDMDADCVYFNVYHHDLRSSRELAVDNENFICMVEYSCRKQFELPERNGFLKWLYSNKEIRGRTKIFWREKWFVVAS